METSSLLPLRGLSYSDMRTWCHRLPVAINSTYRLPDGFDGLYDWKTHTIYIDRNLVYDMKRCVLVHELVHWVHDDRNPTHEQRCRRDTALILVDPLAYRIAEAMYDSTFQIATQLNVTPEIVDDWRKAVHDSPTLLEKGIEQ